MAKLNPPAPTTLPAALAHDATKEVMPTPVIKTA